MEPFRGHNEITSGSPSLFSPFVAKSMKVGGKAGFPFGSTCYNESHDMIIACPGNSTIQFSDATTFEPQKGKKVLVLRGSVVQMTFQPETDTHILGCAPGFIYKYHVSRNELKLLKRCERPVLSITFLNSTFYAFLLVESREICVAGLDSDGDNVVKLDLKCRASCSLCHLSKRNLLFSCLSNGDVRIYRTNKLPHLKVMCSASTGKWITALQWVKVNGKEYIVTASIDRFVRIWHLTKGRMRLIKAMHNEDIPYSLGYLENEKMIAVGYNSNYIKFLRLPSMKLEKTVPLSGGGVHHLFLMKEKDSIGVLSKNENLVEFIKLHPERN